MRKLFILPATALLGLALTAGAQINVYIGTPPPPLRYEVVPVAPYPEAYWIPGYWAPYESHYRWVGGHYDRAPFQNAYWTHGHWDHYKNGWRYHEGRWDRDDKHDHHDYDGDEGNGHGRGHAYGHDKDHDHGHDDR